MAIRASEQSIQVEIDAVEVWPTAPGDGEEARAAYPLPRLRRLGHRETHEFIAIILENDWIKATIVPALGGRVISLCLNGRECLGVERTGDGTFVLHLTPPTSSGSRRVGSLELLSGLEITLHGGQRHQALAPLDVQLIEPEDGDHEAAVILGELDAGSPLSWHARISLAADEAALRIGFKGFNRDLTATSYTSGLRWSGHVGVHAEAGVFADTGPHHADRGADMLGPRLVDNWEALVVPTPELARATSAAGVLLPRAFLPVKTTSAARVLLQDLTEETLEATMDLVAGQSVDLPDHKAVQIRDAFGRVIAAWPEPEPDPQRIALQRDLLHPDRRAATLVAMAHEAIADDDQNRARQLVEDALGLNQEDHLAWWLRSALHRIANLDEDPDEALMNAHFLAPMEPMLRAESFLGMNVMHREPSPLVAPLSDDPDALVEVAVRLREAGLLDDLARWVDEVLRHREVPVLRYLIADSLLTGSRMAVEAADHVARAAKAPINPPYPWRPLERLVLERLHERFPDDARISELRQLMDEFAPDL